jgi:cbb3-type cytochrome oxidase maturation protein
MEVIVILVFIGIVLVTAGLVFFVSRIRQGDFEHGDRLSLLPLESDEPPVTEPPSAPIPGHQGEDPDDK